VVAVEGEDEVELSELEPQVDFIPDSSGAGEDSGNSSGEGEWEGAGERVVAEYPTWQPCARVVAKERADYWEFVVRRPKRLLPTPILCD
jgi:hypothetical protein